jgi:predicted transcriptional regulator
MATVKEEVQKVLDSLPESASLEDVQYHLYVLQKVARGREDLATGRVLTHEEVERRMARWLER